MVVKYCGITKEEEIQHLQKLPIEYVGFVFYKKSKRFVDKEQARRLRAKLKPSISAVGVFVEEEIPKILELLQEGIVQGVQLHGKEDVAYVLELKEKIERANTSPADLILLDGGKGEGKEAEAGLLQKIHRPYILAGGLSPENVVEKIKAFSPYGLDVSSGIEEQREDGVRKSPEKMDSFIRLVREYGKQTL